MNIVRCPNGHFYDSDEKDKCPFCSTIYPLNYNVQEGEFHHTGNLTKFPAGVQGSIEKTVSSPIMNWIPPVPVNSKEEAPYVFISYAHADSDEVCEIISYLKQNHFNIWYDEGIKSGYEWADEISRKIKHCKQFICFISKSSINSESVKDEIHIAWKYNINTIVVYLERLELDGGLEMKLDRKQAVLKYALNEQDFRKKLSMSITQDAVILKKDSNLNDIRINDRYEILNTISKGGTATTYLAKNRLTGVLVVLKHGVYDDTVSGQRIKRSFEGEKDILSRNISPFIPALYDYFYDAQNIYIAESYIEGTSVGEMTRLSLSEKIDIFIKTAKVLKALHAKGIYHCDIKPEHIIVNNHGCFLIDFGSSENINDKPSDDNMKMGTVAYAAPEQFASYNGENDIFGSYQNGYIRSDSDRNIDERTDIYSLGKVMVKTITKVNAVNPYNEADMAMTTVLFADVSKTIGEFSDNPLLQAIIEKMVQEKKSNRYKNMDEVIRVLEDFLKIYNQDER